MQNKKLNILYVAHERKLGGATLSLLTLIDEMKARGHRVYVVVPTGRCPLALELKKRKVPFVSVFFAWIQMPSYWNKITKLCFRCLYLLEPLQVSYIYHIMRYKRIDLVHSNSAVTDFGAKLAEKLQCKHIWHIREFGDADYNFEYLKGKEATWKWMNAHTDKFIFISKCLCDYFKGYADPNKSQNIYNGISENYIIHRNYSEKEKIVFLISGNLVRGKGQMLVLQAANELKRKNYKFEVWIAGSASSMSDSKLYERDLRSYIDRNLQGIAVMLGRVSDMKGLREKADVEIVASQKEAFGRVTVEAMFAGMPVIASAAGANIELIQDGYNGLFFEVNNVKELAAKMESIILQPQMIEELGINAFHAATGKYTVTKNMDLIEKVYYDFGENGLNENGKSVI